MQPREWLMLSMYILVQAPVLTGLSKNQTESLTTNSKRGRGCILSYKKTFTTRILSYRFHKKMKFTHLLRVSI